MLFRSRSKEFDAPASLSDALFHQRPVLQRPFRKPGSHSRVDGKLDEGHTPDDGRNVGKYELCFVDDGFCDRRRSGLGKEQRCEVTRLQGELACRIEAGPSCAELMQLGVNELWGR